MKRAAEPGHDATTATSPTLFERLLRTLALLALGPTLLLATPMEIDTAAILASLLLAASILMARSVPRLLATRLGRPGAFFAASLALGGLGTLLGVLDGCSVGAVSCRASIGVWTFTWLLLPSIVLLVTFALKVFVSAPRAGLRMLRRIRSRTSRPQ